MRVVNGTAHEAAQEYEGRKPPTAMEGVYTEARSEDAVSAMRSALSEACAGLEVELFVKDLGRDVCAESSEALGAEKGADARNWFRRFRSAREFPVPAVAPPIRGNFWPLMAKRVRSLNLPDHRRKEMLVWGTEYPAAWKPYRGPDPSKVVQTREREVAVGSHPKKCVRRA